MGKRGPFWTEEAVRAQYARYMAGEGVEALAREFGGTPSGLRLQFGKLGLPARVPAPRVLSIARVRELYARYQAGERSLVLSREAGVSSTALGKAFRRLGLPMRNVGRVKGAQEKKTFEAVAGHECVPVYAGGPCAVCAP